MKLGFSFLLLPLFLILLLQEIDVLWFSFFVTVTPENDCVTKFFRVYMPGISGDDLVKNKTSLFALFLFFFSLTSLTVDL